MILRFLITPWPYSIFEKTGTGVDSTTSLDGLLIITGVYELVTWSPKLFTVYLNFIRLSTLLLDSAGGGVIVIDGFPLLFISLGMPEYDWTTPLCVNLGFIEGYSIKYGV